MAGHLTIGKATTQALYKLTKPLTEDLPALVEQQGAETALELVKFTNRVEELGKDS